MGKKKRVHELTPENVRDLEAQAVRLRDGSAVLFVGPAKKKVKSEMKMNMKTERTKSKMRTTGFRCAVSKNKFGCALLLRAQVCYHETHTATGQGVGKLAKVQVASGGGIEQ